MKCPNCETKLTEEFFFNNEIKEGDIFHCPQCGEQLRIFESEEVDYGIIKHVEIADPRKK